MTHHPQLHRPVRTPIPTLQTLDNKFPYAVSPRGSGLIIVIITGRQSQSRRAYTRGVCSHIRGAYNSLQPSIVLHISLHLKDQTFVHSLFMDILAMIMQCSAGHGFGKMHAKVYTHVSIYGDCPFARTGSGPHWRPAKRDGLRWRPRWMLVGPAHRGSGLPSANTQIIITRFSCQEAE